MDDALTVIREAVAVVLEVPPGSVYPAQHLVHDLHADSIALVQIGEIVEQELARTRAGLVITDAELDALTTVQSFVDLCHRAAARAGSGAR